MNARIAEAEAKKPAFTVDYENALPYKRGYSYWENLKAWAAIRQEDNAGPPPSTFSSQIVF